MTPAEAALRGLIDGAIDRVLMAGATPWELDEALEAAGWGRGPLLTLDREGLDDAAARRRAHGPARAMPVLDRMALDGRLGVKVGVGFYRYPGGGGAVIDPLIDDLVAEEAHFAKAPRPGMSGEAAAVLFVQVLREVRAGLTGDQVALFDEILRRGFSAPADVFD